MINKSHYFNNKKKTYSYMYNLVHTTRFWNNHYHVSSKSQIGKPVNQNIGGF
jgi:hypothetical protein